MSLNSILLTRYVCFVSSFTYFHLFRAVLKLGHWKVNAKINSKSVPPYLL